MTKSSDRSKRAPAPEPQKRAYVKQSDVPGASLDEAARVPQAILDHYAGKPTTPLYVAKALNVDPKGSQFKVLTGAAIAFGLIEGGAQASAISVTDLGKRLLRPQTEGADLLAKREALQKPRVFGDFLTKYDGHPLPRPDIAQNVLEEMGVPRDKTSEAFARIEAAARSVGFLQDIKGKSYVSLQSPGSPDVPAAPAPSAGEQVQAQNGATEEAKLAPAGPSRSAPDDAILRATRGPGTVLAVAIADDERRRRVFITHGKNRDLVEPIKKLLEFGELEPVVSVERQTVSKPVPEKVMDDMRACGAAIIHVDVDRTITDKDGQEHVLLNPNVLIEIGAAMAFYGRRFILLVRDGVKLPSNLQGLYEVRYSGETIDSNSTIRLLEAIKDIKNHGLPTDPKQGDG